MPVASVAAAAASPMPSSVRPDGWTYAVASRTTRAATGIRSRGGTRRRYPTCEDGPVSQASETGRPGRYQRSFGGLIGSMIVLVLVVLGIVAFRGAFRNTPS